MAARFTRSTRRGNLRGTRRHPALRARRPPPKKRGNLRGTVGRKASHRKQSGFMNIAPGVAGQSNFSSRLRASKKVTAMERVGASNTYTTNSTQRILCNSGFQGIQEFAASDYDALHYIMQLQPSGTAVPPTQYVLNSCTNTLSIANNSLTGGHVDIYDIFYKRDTTSNYQNNSGTTFGKGRAIAFFQGGMQDQDSTTHDINAYAFLKTTPSASRAFRDSCKVVKRTRILLAAGSTHEHTVNLSPNRLIDSSLIGINNGQKLNMVHGLSYSCMVVGYGLPASAGSAGAGTLVISTAPLALDCVWQQQYRYTFVQDNVNNFFYVDNLSSFAPGAQTAINAGGSLISATAITNP